jgi:hypothetical protein
MGYQRVVRLSTTSHPRYRLFVAASDVGEVVASAGGWMCDRIQAGWDVIVAVSESRDLRPLQILGVTTVVTGHGFQSIGDRGEATAIGIASEAFDHNELLCREVLNVLDQGATEVIIWGGTIPSSLEGRVHRMQHRLSGAARAFKTHAVAAAAIPAAEVSATEEFFSSARCYDPPGLNGIGHRLVAAHQADHPADT